MLVFEKEKESQTVENWLSLNEYANRHQVSISTLRRRIKSNKIEYKLEEGRYFLLEDDQPKVPSMTTPAPKQIVMNGHSESTDLSLNRLLLDELKRAYLDSLQSKEDQILYLKQQVSDLRTLVMVLEKENERLRG